MSHPTSPSTDEATDGAGGLEGRIGRWAIALTLLVLLPAACSGGSGGPGVAQVSSTPGASSTSKSGELAFSACMRSHGLASFPDPGGELPAGMDPNSPQYQAAQKACQSLLPQGQGGTVSATDRERFLKFSACMRSQRVPNYPDPAFSHGVNVLPGQGVDTSSPQFQAAQKACASWLPNGGKGGQTTHGGGGSP